MAIWPRLMPPSLGGTGGGAELQSRSTQPSGGASDQQAILEASTGQGGALLPISCAVATIARTNALWKRAAIIPEDTRAASRPGSPRRSVCQSGEGGVNKRELGGTEWELRLKRWVLT